MHLCPGDFVEALGDEEPVEGLAIQQGRIYQLEDVERATYLRYECSEGERCRRACDGVTLTSDCPKDRLWWCSQNFRFVYRPNGDLLRALCAQVRSKRSRRAKQ